ncbi:hypothetical protein KFL_009460030 [Klebsormidium nitens]|uniref:Uncharacterized protein n=1 Tax=Klebsormidium nitens TaxID=105231 RepID=A0A1Y1IU54_KLENI|nr:hypothetical protein KFL_009460030 [Klebsormidium nitens]|eukprot:GAQ92207.1 hypothetical protein KFL_009460030 [Klebsormidium nitens]
MSGTAELAQDFFPVSIRIARHWLPWLWDRVFPAYGALLCPKPFVTVQVFDRSLSIGWPVLLVVAFLGVIIGWGIKRPTG